MGNFLRVSLACIALIAHSAIAAGKTELTWYGHSAYRLTTPTGKVVLIDPWITNPANKNGKEDLDKLDRVDLILLTHGHADHVGNSVDIARKTGARLVATADLSRSMVAYKAYPKEAATAATFGHFGGEITVLDGELKVAFVPARHGSASEAGEGMPGAGLPVVAGEAGGFLISVTHGPAIYHAGDTDVFADMALVNQFRKVDVFIAPIGDKFTMGPSRAALATRIVAPGKMVIPMHYGTFPALTGTPAAFEEALKAEKVNTPMREMKIGETLSF